MSNSTELVHPTAEIDDDVEVGSETRIWARAHIRQGARIGANCNLGELVYVGRDVVIGSACKIQNQALLYEGSVIEDEVFIGPGACLANDRWPRASTPEGLLRDQDDWQMDGVTLKRGCSIGAHAVVTPGCTVGEWATIGAGAIVTSDVAAYSLVAGNPARSIGWVCSCGNKLDNEFRCVSCGARYSHQAGVVSPI